METHKPRRRHTDFRRGVTRKLAHLHTQLETIMGTLAELKTVVDDLAVKQAAQSDAITAVLALDGDPVATGALISQVTDITAKVEADTKRLTDRVAATPPPPV